MKKITTVKKMQHLTSVLRLKGKTIAVVPTMGFLHEGHLSLVKKAKSAADIVIVTIFVNPTQFGPLEDFAKYPRSEKSDLNKLKKMAVDFVFTPKPDDMYPKGYQTWIDVTETTKPLCGAVRPGHFRGVATVVLKLLLITQATHAFFGKKDYQQLITIRQMARDLNLSAKIIGAEIVREKDGLALSSRNTYLNEHEHRVALNLSRALFEIRKIILKGNLNITALKHVILKQFLHDKEIKIHYVEFLDAQDLSALKTVKLGHTLVAVAAFVGKTRLIDNIII